jgi:RNA polymerase sigma-70 factor, ECF subfamily
LAGARQRPDVIAQGIRGKPDNHAPVRTDLAGMILRPDISGYRNDLLNNMDTHPVYTDEEQILARARKGDRVAWQLLFERHREIAYRVAWRVLGNGEDALDAVQEGFIRAYRSLATFAGASSFKTWLVRIVYRQAIDIGRKASSRRVLSIDQGEQTIAAALPDTRGDTDPAEPLARADLGRQLATAIEQLPVDQRQAFVLHADGELTYAQIAEAQGVPIGTVMSRIYYARRKLRELLAGAVDGTNEKDTSA